VRLSCGSAIVMEGNCIGQCEKLDEKFSSATLDDPMLQFHCWTAWCHQGTIPKKDQDQHWNYGPIDQCAAHCLSQKHCTGIMSAHVPFQKDKCVFIYNDQCKKGEGQVGGAMFTLTFSAPQACERVTVDIRGDWAPVIALDAAKVHKKIAVGKSESTTTAWNAAVKAEMEDTFGGELSSSFAHTLTQSRLEEHIYDLDPADGKQVWQWVLKVHQRLKPGYITVKTVNLVQTDHKGQVPECLPGWFKGKTNKNNCVNNKKVANQKVNF